MPVRREDLKKKICPLSAMCFILQELGELCTREVVRQRGKEHNREENQKESHRLPPHSLIFTNKAKEQNISIFFPLFLPKEHLHFEHYCFLQQMDYYTRTKQTREY